MINQLREYLELNHVTIVEDEFYYSDIYNKKLTLYVDDLEESIIKGFTTFFCHFSKNSQLETEGMEITGITDRREYREIIYDEIYSATRFLVDGNFVQESPYPNLFPNIVKSIKENLKSFIFPIEGYQLKMESRLENLITKILRGRREYLLTGSLALSLQGSLYRDTKGGLELHDIDIVTLGTTLDVLRNLDKLKYNIKVLYFDRKRVKCLYYPRNVTLYKYTIKRGFPASYTLRGEDGRVVGGLTYTKEGGYTKWGVQTIAIEFTVKDITDFPKLIEKEILGTKIMITHYSSIFKMKLEMNRPKDIKDYALFKPFG